MKRMSFVTLLLGMVTAVLTACSTPAPVEVTRIVTQDVPVTVEVTREVTELATVETQVEVTRIVEVTVEVVATPTPAAEIAEATAAVPTAASTAASTAAETVEGEYYTIQSGDTLSTIADKTGVSAEEIMAANNMSNANVLIAGQDLLIPGWTGEIIASAQPTAPAATAPSQPAQPAAPAGANLLPNPSFEEGWYFFQGVSEWQLPNGWSFSVIEGANSEASGGRYFRPEVRVLVRTDLPGNEANLFVMDGNSTIKAFKGDAPTNFAIFRDVALEPGSYRLTVRFVPDSVLGYEGSQKVFNNDPLSAETRIIVGNGGTNWAGSNVGAQNTVTYDFTLDSAQTVQLGAGFRNRFEQSNNGWFIDDWSLQKLQ